MKLCPNCHAPLDKRASKWRVRVRLYAKGNGEPLADTDPYLPADKPGETLITTLPAVAEHVAKLATGFHGVAVTGLDLPTLRHRLKALRPTLSRRKGNAAWRVPYSITTALSSPPAAVRVAHYTARVDVVRVQQEMPK